MCVAGKLSTLAFDPLRKRNVNDKSRPTTMKAFSLYKATRLDSRCSDDRAFFVVCHLGKLAFECVYEITTDIPKMRHIFLNTCRSCGHVAGNGVHMNGANVL